MVPRTHLERWSRCRVLRPRTSRRSGFGLKNYSPEEVIEHGLIKGMDAMASSTDGASITFRT